MWWYHLSSNLTCFGISLLTWILCIFLDGHVLCIFLFGCIFCIFHMLLLFTQSLARADFLKWLHLVKANWCKERVNTWCAPLCWCAPQLFKLTRIIAVSHFSKSNIHPQSYFLELNTEIFVTPSNKKHSCFSTITSGHQRSKQYQCRTGRDFAKFRDPGIFREWIILIFSCLN